MKPAENQERIVIQQRGKSTRLVVLLHAITMCPDDLAHVVKSVQDAMPDADIFTPAYPAQLLSFASPVEIVKDLVTKIDRLWQQRTTQFDGQQYQGLILIGHSLGALLARKLYVFACGEQPSAPFEPGVDLKAPRAWAGKVERIILLAGMNRGWRVSHHMPLARAGVWMAGIWMGNLVQLFAPRQKRLLIFQIERGAPFLTDLRLQWLAMRNAAKKGGPGGAMTIQLLGSVDDIVSPEDNIDLETGADFYYVDVPFSTHANVILMDDSKEGRDRERVFRETLTQTRRELKHMQVRPQDLPLPAHRMDVTDVIFVIHGIRDLGHWTHKIARRVKALGLGNNRVFETETSSYGYFPMLSFLLPSRRRAKVEWLMDQYVEAKSLYPNASFSYVGHSNGTYLLTRALREYRACRFKRVVFAGSVVRTDYGWSHMLKSGRVEAVLNYVATGDWVVALFPKVLEMIRWQDLGSAGHDGFKAQNKRGKFAQFRYIRGGHGAALQEKNWDEIANFILGKSPDEKKNDLHEERRDLWVTCLGYVAPLIWIVIALIAYAGGYAILVCTSWPVTLQVAAFLAYLWAIWKVLTHL